MWSEFEAEWDQNPKEVGEGPQARLGLTVGGQEGSCGVKVSVSFVTQNRNYIWIFGLSP